MFSGKSTELARRIRRHKIANARVLVVKYAGDTRYENECVGEESQDGTPRMSSLKSRVITHDRVSLPAVPLRTLAQMDNVVGNFDVVGIDEGQFFPDLHEACDRWARLGKTVIVAALDATFQRKPFNDVLALVPIAEEITKLSAVCSNCGEDAAFTKRVNSTSTDVELIGGSETYVASCRDCFELEFENLTTEMCARKGASSQAAGKSSAQKHRFDDAASTRKRRSSAFGATPNALRGSVGASDKKPTHGDDTEKTSEATPSLAATPPMSLSRVGEKMRSLNLESPSTPAVFGGFGSPMTVAKKSATETNAEKGAHGEKTNSAGAGSAIYNQIDALKETGGCRTRTRCSRRARRRRARPVADNGPHQQGHGRRREEPAGEREVRAYGFDEEVNDCCEMLVEQRALIPVDSFFPINSRLII